jgi:thaumarchaeosortase
MMLTRMRFFLTQINIKACAKNLAIPFSFITPILLLFVLDPNSFNYTWKGRTLYLFFLWLLFLEIILDWEKLSQKNLASLKKPRIIVMGIMASIPIVYVIGVNFLGLDQMLIEIGKQILTFWHFSLDNLRYWPLSLEYLVFTIFFTATIWLAYEVDGLKQFSISLCLLGTIGTIYMIDTFYPYGAFTPFQAFVPFTASSAAQVLNWMGYKTSFMPYQVQGTPVLYVSGSSGSVGFGIGWPCAGVQSLFIYTCVILLFLKKSAIPMIQKIIYFIIGAIDTYIVNILRIVSIYIIAINQDMRAAQVFHDYYGELYSITWIIAYLIIIILSRTIPAKLSVLKVKLQKQTLPSDDRS